MKRPSLVACLLWLCLSPALAIPLDEAHQELWSGRYDRAEKLSEAALREAQTPAQNFAARGLLLRSRFAGVHVQQAWDLLKEMESFDRSSLPRSHQVDFYLARGAMTMAQGQQDLSRKNFEEALACSDSPDQKLDVLITAFPSALSEEKPDRARHILQQLGEIASSCSFSPTTMGRLALTEAAWWKHEGEPELERLPLAQATHAFRQAHNAPLESRARINSLLVEQKLQHPVDWPQQIDALLQLLSQESDALPRLRLIANFCSIVPNPVLQSQRARLAAELDRFLDSPDGNLRLQALNLRLTYITPPSEVQLLCQKYREMVPPDVDEALWKLALFHLEGMVWAASHDVDKEMECFDQAQKWADAHPWGAGDAVLAGRSPATLRLSRSIILRTQGKNSLARQELTTLLNTRLSEGEQLIRVMGRSQLMVLEAQRACMEEAETQLRAAMEECETLTNPVIRAVAYQQLFTSLRDKSASAEALISLLTRDRKLSEQALSACETWARMEERQRNKLNAGLAYYMRGLVLESLARASEAGESYRQSCEALSEAAESGFFALPARQWSELLLQQGKYEEALALLRQAVKTSRGAGSHMDSTGNEEALARALQRAGHPQEALETARHCLQRRRSDGLNLEYQALLLLGQICHQQKRLKEAEDFLNQGQQLTLNRTPSVRVAFLKERAAVAGELGHPDKADRLLEEAIQLQTESGELGELPALTSLRMKLPGITPSRAGEIGSNALTRLTEMSLQLTHQQRARWLLDQPLKSLVDQVARTWQDLGHSRRAQDAFAFWRSLEDSSHPSGREADSLRQKREELAELRSRLQTVPAQQRAGLESQLASTRAELLTHIQELRQSHPDFESLVTTDPVDLLQLQKRLGPQDVAVQLYPAEETLYFQVLRRDGVHMRESRISRRRLTALIDTLRRQLNHPGDNAREWQASVAELSHILVDPIKGDLPPRGNCWILPTAELWYVPWDVLALEGKPLLDRFALSLLTARGLNGLLSRPDRQEGPALVVAAPDAADLPAAQTEASNVAGQVKGRLLQGPQSTRANLRQQSHGCALLHLATHSRVDQHSLGRSSLQLWGGGLTLSDIYSLELAHGALVVLSSCNSGVGEDHPGREVTSLANGFHLAGASTVISTLWPVDDLAQSRLFPRFYLELGRGASRGEALARAKRALRADPATAHPTYWSGVYLSGDPR